MKKIGRLIILLISLFCYNKNVYASSNYLIIDNLDDIVDTSYTGLISYNNTFYYTSNGEIIKNEFITIDEKKYFFNQETGSMEKSGWFIVNNNKYYANTTTGELYIGKNNIDGKEYAFNNEGILEEEIQTKNEEVIKNNETNDIIPENEEIVNNNTTINNNNAVKTEQKQTNNIIARQLNNTNNKQESGWQVVDNKTYYTYPDGTKATGWVTIDNVKCYFNELGQLIQKDALKIIDVSHHQGTIDWGKVKNTDVDGAIIRLGYGTSYTTDAPGMDRQWHNNYSGTTSQDLLFGIYLYSYAIDEVSANIEADYVIKNLNEKNFNKNLVVYYDLEENPWTTNLTINDYDIIIKTFINRLEKEGYRAEVYTYKNWAETRLSDYARSKLTWIAHYTDVCTYKGSYNGWQYTSSGTVDGINGNTDISVFINNKKLNNLELESNKPVEVEENTSPDLSNLIVYKVYSNNKKEQINNFTYSKTPITKDTKMIIISYTEDGVTKTLEVPIKVIEHVHDWSEWIIIKEPTETEEGLKERYCQKNNSHRETMTIDKLPIVEYKIIEGADQTITNKIDKDLIIKINANYELFDKLFIDDELVDQSNYKVTNGSTIIAISSKYLNSLSLGKHIIKVLFKDTKEVSTSLNIVEEKTNNMKLINNSINKNIISNTNSLKTINPKTIDNSNIYIIMFIFSIIGIMFNIIIRKKYITI